MPRTRLMRRLLALLLLSSALPAAAGNPYLTPGFPQCTGKEKGYWAIHRQLGIDKQVHVFLALTTINFLQPSTVICWVDPEQEIQALPQMRHPIRPAGLPDPGDGQEMELPEGRPR